ncbi:hypothetical protein B0H14DRAFT_3490373 [Mycena olivaceomarginata]|nr:hypothetical protein B0H14DRAFT_3490373 [Mycena olivaceomarginata]
MKQLSPTILGLAPGAATKYNIAICLPPPGSFLTVSALQLLPATTCLTAPIGLRPTSNPPFNLATMPFDWVPVCLRFGLPRRPSLSARAIYLSRLTHPAQDLIVRRSNASTLGWASKQGALHP